MTEAFGIDTQTSHLDLINWGPFQQWNNGIVPAFAGRNFLRGDSIWVGAEATTALSSPQPDDISKVALLTPMIAPIQGASPSRQQIPDALGLLYGKIDGAAICRRLISSLAAGELRLKDSQIVHVYLQVDPSVGFSSDYWAGWADTVANAIAAVDAGANGSRTAQHPFRPCIMCAFTLADGILNLDPNVASALAAAESQHQDMATSCSGFWADAPDVDPVYQRPGAQPDFGRFGQTPAPIWLWRFAQTLLDATGQPIADPALPIAADACAAAGSPNRFGWEFMLDTVEWQPSVAVVNRGFSFGYAVTAANIAAIARGDVPDVTRVEQCSPDIRPAITISGGPMRTMGLYVRETVGATGLTPAAVKAVGDTSLRLFTVFEHSAGATNPAYYDPAAGNGTNDANIALTYVAETLFQPPHSTVFFVFDWSPDEATPDQLSQDDLNRINAYISDIHAGYLAYLSTHPNRPYRLGLYGSGVELLLAYQEGGFSGFWQSPSVCRGSNMPPNWPWPHATRWQAIPSSFLDPRIGGLKGEDLDYDWADGGDWSSVDPFNVELTQFEADQNPALLPSAKRVFGNLITP
jgi:Domain of unknown function (DUF1906)